MAISTSNFKVVDVETMSKNCKACISSENLRKENKEMFDAGKENHVPECSVNYFGETRVR